VTPRPLAAHDPRDFPVLYVDDEAANLRIFELTFRREFTVLTAQSAEEGMQLLNENPVAVVLSDHKMPGMTGVEFLSRVRELDEQAIRILVTAYGDAETLGSAINDGRIYRYVPKPWDPDEMAVTLRRAIERYALDRERSALVDELTFLNWLSRTLHRELDPERVVRLLIDAAHNELGFDGAAVLFFTSDRRALRWASIAPRDEVAERVGAIELTRSAAPEFFEALEARSIQLFGLDQLVEVEAPVRQWISEVSAEEMVVVPLSGETEVIGALVIDNRSGGRRFGADDRTLLDGLSTQAVIALENARTVAALRSSREQLRRADRIGALGRVAIAVSRRLGEELPEAGATEIGPALRALAQLAEAPVESGAAAAVDICALTRETVELVAAGVGASALRAEIAPDAPKVAGDRGALQQLLLALLLEALDAAPVGEPVVCRVHSDVEDGAMLSVLEVAGAGVDVGAEPLGPWLGAVPGGVSWLVARQIVSEHGGAIGVREGADDRRVVEVRLPAASDDASA
jgi:CheY-like chemotaxis protein